MTADELSQTVLLSPNAVALPYPERGPREPSPTRRAVGARWPEIERLARDGRAVEAIGRLEALAQEMRQATAMEPELRRDTLTLARRIVYDDILEVARVLGGRDVARAALARCLAWDEELRPRLKELLSR